MARYVCACQGATTWGWHGSRAVIGRATGDLQAQRVTRQRDRFLRGARPREDWWTAACVERGASLWRSTRAAVGWFFGAIGVWILLAAILPKGLPVGIVVLGIVYGAIYAILAVGIVLIYRGDRIINFAQASDRRAAGRAGHRAGGHLRGSLRGWPQGPASAPPSSSARWPACCPATSATVPG